MLRKAEIGQLRSANFDRFTHWRSDRIRNITPWAHGQDQNLGRARTGAEISAANASCTALLSLHCASPGSVSPLNTIGYGPDVDHHQFNFERKKKHETVRCCVPTQGAPLREYLLLLRIGIT